MHVACFRDFSLPLWQVFSGNILMFATCAFYVAFWAVAYRPDANRKTAGAVVLFVFTLAAGAAAIATMSIGIHALSQAGRGFPAVFIWLGAAASYIVLLAATRIFFKRAVTSELLFMTVWAALELWAISVVQGSGRFGAWQAPTLSALVALSTGVGMVCYVLYYRLDKTARFRNGFIPLIADAVVVAVFLAVLAAS